ncbi:MAG: hypothetical protein JJ866_05830 [Roseibium sp.]|uniref:hypothetical protein n=1 Tax=Roseibium sp. TaxID=1936156 RepID=UPI001B0A5CB1|nr:hypothetical protein [Roseibium sp.]MBO6891445.1 hypothetical protein [Roseibium sp.]MBO6929284.1 hypothetical protein [Roseibium sp.]
MQPIIITTLEEYYPEHAQPKVADKNDLKASVEAAGLSDMWNMILTFDYGVTSPDELSPEKRDEFLNVMSLLLKAFDR